MRIKALTGKAIDVARSLRDISGLTLTDCVNIARGNEDFPEECFDELCNTLGNPDLFFELSE